MFRTLKISNFQSHSETFLQFGKGVNVIQGLSSTGKTAILRALRLLLENRPQGARYFSDFAGDRGKTEVELKLFDGQSILLQKKIHVNKKGEKSLDESIYSLKGKIDFESSAPSSGIPDQIDQVLNMSELNMQRQFDEPFLVMSSPGEVARTVNQITKLEQVDAWVSNITSQINQNQRDVDRLTTEIKAEEIALKKYDGLDYAEIIVRDLVFAEQDLAMLSQQKEKLDDYLSKFEEVRKGLDKIDEFLSAEKYVRKIGQLDEGIAIQVVFSRSVRSWEFCTESMEKYGSDILELEVLGNKLAEVDYSKQMEQYDKLDQYFSVLQKDEEWLKKIPDVKAIDSSLEKFAGFKTEIDEFEKFEKDMDRLDTINAYCQESEKNMAVVKKQYLDIFLKTKKCPMCYSIIDSEMTERIGREL